MLGQTENALGLCEQAADTLEEALALQPGVRVPIRMLILWHRVVMHHYDQTTVSISSIIRMGCLHALFWQHVACQT